MTFAAFNTELSARQQVPARRFVPEKLTARVGQSHVAAFGYTDKNDVYMIRNFGKMLRR